MLDGRFAQRFADDWIAAWNSHDLHRILSHYTDDFELSSPVIVKIAGEPSGRLKGKAAVGAYWRRALELLPDLHFDQMTVQVGIDTLVLHYFGHRGLSAEVFQFNEGGKVVRSFAHYTELP